MNPRLLTHHVLTQVIVHHRSLDDALTQHNQADDTKQAALIQAMAYGVCRFYPRLQVLLTLLMPKALRRKDKDIEILLYIGLYQLLEMHIAEHAVVSETVAVCKSLRKVWAKKLLNGVLRQFLRDKYALLKNLHDSDSARYAHPQWLLQPLQDAWPQQAESIFCAANQPPPMMLRVNTAITTRENYLGSLSLADISARVCVYSEQAIVLDKACAVKLLPGFESGLLSVQDSAAQLAAGLLDLQPGLRVLDACAAPGGKTCHIAEMQPQLALLQAVDVSAERLRLVEQNLQRLAVSAQVRQGDALKPERWWDGQQFDRILLDAPCSATGVIRRHPDIKLLRQPEDIEKLLAIQQQMLHCLWPLLKSGGMLLYSTCSILPQENSQQIERFLQQQCDAKEQVIHAKWGISQSAGRQILPGVAHSTEDMDGFYYAKLYKL